VRGGAFGAASLRAPGFFAAAAAAGVVGVVEDCLAGMPQQ